MNDNDRVTANPQPTPASDGPKPQPPTDGFPVTDGDLTSKVGGEEQVKEQNPPE